VDSAGWMTLWIVLALLTIHYALGFAAAPLKTPPQVIAHRGGPAYQPENTLAAYERAMADGVDYIEFDVQMTKDGCLVVIHDESVDRTTDGSGAVTELMWEEIRDLDAGGGQRVPRFEEVVALAKSGGVGIMPEAKSPHLYPGIERRMLRVIEEAGYVERTIVQSFSADSLERFRRMNPDIELSPLYGRWVLTIDRDQPGNAGVVCPMAEMVLINPGIIRRAHADGRRVFVWFGRFENPIVLRLMIAFGVDGLIVDDQLELISLLEG